MPTEAVQKGRSSVLLDECGLTFNNMDLYSLKADHYRGSAETGMRFHTSLEGIRGIKSLPNSHTDGL